MLEKMIRMQTAKQEKQWSGGSKNMMPQIRFLTMSL